MAMSAARTVRATAALLCIALTAACSSGGRSATTVPNRIATSQHPTPAACVLVQQVDATNLFGRQATGVSVPNSSHAQSVCGFGADTNADKNAIDNIAYSLLVYVYDDTTHYAPEGVKGAERVAGVGEHAFRYVRGDLVTLLFVQHGETVLLAYSITGLVSHAKSRAAMEQLVALARTAAGRM